MVKGVSRPLFREYATGYYSEGSENRLPRPIYHPPKYELLFGPRGPINTLFRPLKAAIL